MCKEIKILTAGFVAQFEELKICRNYFTLDFGFSPYKHCLNYRDPFGLR